MSEHNERRDMDDGDWLAVRFEENRSHLIAVAHRMLGSQTEADDAVQESWLRLSRSDVSAVHNLRGWLTTVVARVCLDMLRSRKSRSEETLDVDTTEKRVAGDASPEHEVVMADSVGLAMLVVLETLAPAERVAFVLHDMFDVPFEEIGSIVGRSTEAARQLASRARRRVRGVSPPEADMRRQREIVDAFLAASRQGEFGALLALLDPEVVLRADAAAVRIGASQEVRGAAAVAEVFSGRAAAAQPASVNGAAGLVWVSGGRPRIVFRFTISDDKIATMELIGDAESISALDLSF